MENIDYHMNRDNVKSMGLDNISEHVECGVSNASFLGMPNLR